MEEEILQNPPGLLPHLRTGFAVLALIVLSVSKDLFKAVFVFFNAVFHCLRGYRILRSTQTQPKLMRSLVEKQNPQLQSLSRAQGSRGLHRRLSPALGGPHLPGL